MIEINLSEVTDEELEELRVRVESEKENRYFIRNAERQAEFIAEKYSMAIGRYDGQDWKQPTGAHDAYKSGSIVTHNGKTWKSIMPVNVWEPGVTGWREVDSETGEVTVSEWTQPKGAHDAYKKGDKVKFAGREYESVINNNVWNPEDYPAGWVSLEPEPEPEPVEDPVPEPDPTEPEPVEDSVPDWVQPGGHNPYKKGDRVKFSGSVWESLIDNNVWSPTDYPAGWSKVG